MYLRSYDAQFNEQLKGDKENVIKKVQEMKLLQEKDKIAKIAVVSNNYPNIARQKRLNEPGSIVFKCNYCNGGKSSEQIGYAGVCSDEIIKYNILVENRTWCSDVECDCQRYLDKKITRKELDSIYNEYGSVCYESKMLVNWGASAGVTQTGVNRGTTRRLKRIQPNSLAILTTRDPNDEGEKNRYVFGVFIIDKMYEGDSEKSGYVSCTNEYKIKLSSKEAHLIPYWKYHSNDNQPSKPLWSSGLYRYILNSESAQILRDIVKIKKGTRDEAHSEKLYEYFCRVNKIDISELRVPRGALHLN